MEEVRHPQPQRAQCFQSAGLILPNRGMSKYSALYIRHLLCLLWLTYIPQGQCECRLEQLFKKNDSENRKRGYEIQIEGFYPCEQMQRSRGPAQSSD